MLLEMSIEGSNRSSGSIIFGMGARPNSDALWCGAEGLGPHVHTTITCTGSTATPPPNIISLPRLFSAVEQVLRLTAREQAAVPGSFNDDGKAHTTMRYNWTAGLCCGDTRYRSPLGRERRILLSRVLLLSPPRHVF